MKYNKRKPVEVIAWFNTDGNPRPIKLRYLTNDERLIKIKVDRVIEKSIDNLAANKMLKYKCETVYNNSKKLFELRYELETCRWYLYR